MEEEKVIKDFQYFTRCLKCSAIVLIKDNIEERWLSSSGIAGHSELQYQKQLEEMQRADIFLFNTDDAGLDERIGF